MKREKRRYLLPQSMWDAMRNRRSRKWSCVNVPVISWRRHSIRSSSDFRNALHRSFSRFYNQTNKHNEAVIKLDSDIGT